MRKALRILGIVLVGLLAMVALAYAAGTVDVAVHEKKADGANIHLLVPAPLVTMAVRFVPDDQLAEAARQMRPWLPAILAASEQLQRTPDAVLVEVDNETEKVHIAKLGGDLVIDVNDTDDMVHVALPLSTVSTVAREFQNASPSDAGI